MSVLACRYTHGLSILCYTATGATGMPLSAYSLEYGTALLMNLCLRQRGKESAYSSEVDILEVLSDYLEVEDEQVNTLVQCCVDQLWELTLRECCGYRDAGAAV